MNPHIPLPEPTGAQWVELNLRNRLKCYDNFRMYPDAFLRLHDTLVRDHGLKSTQELGSREALAMFVWICACRQPYRQVRERFDRSLDTASRKMGHIANCLFSLAQYVICPKDLEFRKVHGDLLPYGPYFDGCIGALDGTHVFELLSVVGQN